MLVRRTICCAAALCALCCRLLLTACCQGQTLTRSRSPSLGGSPALCSPLLQGEVNRLRSGCLARALAAAAAVCTTTQGSYLCVDTGLQSSDVSGCMLPARQPVLRLARTYMSPLQRSFRAAAHHVASSIVVRLLSTHYGAVFTAKSLFCFTI